MNKSGFSFFDHVVWIALLIVLAVFVVLFDFKLEGSPVPFKIFVIAILLFIVAIQGVKAGNKRDKPGKGVCDICAVEGSLWKGYAVKSGLKVSESVTRTSGGQDVQSTAYSDVRTHSYQSCAFCEVKKYIFRILALCLTVCILMLFGLIWPDPKESKFLSETLTFLSLLTVSGVFYSVRFLCPVGKLEKKAIQERSAADDPKNRRKWEAFG